MRISSDNPVKKRVENFIFFLLTRINNTNSSDLCVNGEARFLQNIVEEYSNEKEKFVCFDVGANLGEYSDLLDHLFEHSRADKQFFLFEPQKLCFQELRKRFSKRKYCHLINAAASNKEGKLTLHLDRKKSGLASLYDRSIDLKKSLLLSEKVTVVTLRKIIEQMKITRISLLKLDVEGHEFSVLKGLGKYLSPQFIDFIQFEYGGANIDSRTYLRDFVQLLSDKGFIISKIYPNGLREFTYTQKEENFQYQNFVASSSTHTDTP